MGDYLRAGEEEQAWTVFDADAALRGRIVTPPRFTLHVIGSDYLLGSGRDELDVERIPLYRLVKAPLKAGSLTRDSATAPPRP